MPKPTAIKLSRKTVPLICNQLNLTEQDVSQELEEPVSYYYVTDCLLMGSLPMPYMVYEEATFLDEFASVPPGIEERFVPVTQVKA